MHLASQGRSAPLRPLITHDELGDHKVLVKDRNLGPGYPVILGCDVAGTVEVVAPGSAAASRFRVGDRVFGFGANRGFQDYVALEDKLMATIPGDMTYHEPVVPGLCIATSAMFLFGEDYLHLDYPKLGLPKKGKSVLIWGGIGRRQQCDPARANFDCVRSLGAVQVFDYKDPEVTERVAAELDEGECAGVFMAAGLKEGNVAAWKVAAASKQTEAIDLRRFIAEKGHEGVKEAINRARGNMEEDQGVSPVKLVVE
ncbi:hypothetical protein L209DRAFT_778000 [Thermothelomyces heterothallicus CBS 203.75]